MTDKTVKSLYWTLYLENRILKIQRNNEKTSEVSACLGRHGGYKEEAKRKESEKGSCNAMQRKKRLSKKERREDALALRADERRDKLRKAVGRSKYP